MDKLLHWRNLSRPAFRRCQTRSEIVSVAGMAGNGLLLGIGELGMRVVAARGWGPSPRNPFVLVQERVAGVLWMARR